MNTFTYNLKARMTTSGNAKQQKRGQEEQWNCIADKRHDNKKPSSLSRLVTLLAFALFFSVQALAGAKWVVKDQELTVWDSPEYFNRLGMVHRGYEIDAIAIEGNMIRFNYNGKTAYVATYCCEMVDEESKVGATQDTEETPAQPATANASKGEKVMTESHTEAPQQVVAGQDARHAEERQPSFPAWVVILFGLLGLAFGALFLLTLVFSFYYAFRYEKLRSWFNNKCKSDCIPAKRFNKLLIAPAVAVGLTLATNLASMSLVPAMSGGGKLVAVLTFVVLLIAVPAVVLLAAYNKNRSLYGSRAARWITAYSILSIVAIYLIFVIAVYLILIYVCLCILSEVGSSSAKSSGDGSTSGSGNSARSCSKCRHCGAMLRCDIYPDGWSKPSPNACSHYEP